VTSLLFDNMFPEFTLFSSLFYRFLIRNWGFGKDGNVSLIWQKDGGSPMHLIFVGNSKIFMASGIISSKIASNWSLIDSNGNE
ncbi:MAG: hypothetical protein ACR5LA_09825, partial [Wolbachia sp.]